MDPSADARAVTTSADDRLLRGIRIIRRLSGPPESPWPGRLAVMTSGEGRVLVDVDAVGDAWPGWAADPGGHVVASLDLLRVSTGHLVALPVCGERLEDLVARRESAGTGLTDGERLTVAISLLRGMAELAELGAADACGSWWVTDAARPVFAASPGQEGAATATATILRGLAESPGGLSAAIADAAAAVSTPASLRREADRIEARLFDLADAEPLALTVLSPRAARGLAVPRDAPPPAHEDDAARDGLWSRLGRHVDADLADLASRATTRVWRWGLGSRRSSPHRSGRRAGPWIAAAALVTALVGGAALLPSAADEPPPAAIAPTPTGLDTAVEPSAAPSASSVDAEEADDAAGAGQDLEEIAGRLLDARIACGADATCLEGVFEAPHTTIPSGVVDLPASKRRVTLLDELGGAAVLRVESTEGSVTPQLVVIVRSDERWLLRDVHDVAEQPS